MYHSFRDLLTMPGLALKLIVMLDSGILEGQAQVSVADCSGPHMGIPAMPMIRYN